MLPQQGVARLVAPAGDPEALDMLLVIRLVEAREGFRTVETDDLLVDQVVELTDGPDDELAVRRLGQGWPGDQVHERAGQLVRPALHPAGEQTGQVAERA